MCQDFATKFISGRFQKKENPKVCFELCHICQITF